MNSCKQADEGKVLEGGTVDATVEVFVTSSNVR